MKFFLLLGLFSGSASAYFDPASGSILLQGLLAGLAGLLLTVKIFFARIKDFFRSLFSGGKD